MTLTEVMVELIETKGLLEVMKVMAKFDVKESSVTKEETKASKAEEFDTQAWLAGVIAREDAREKKLNINRQSGS